MLFIAGNAAAASVPPALPTLEQKMEGLRITSMRFSSRTSTTIAGGREKLPLPLPPLFGSSSEPGEETIAPPAENVSIGLFGQPLDMRLVKGTGYIYLRKLGSLDQGRPWIKLGRDGFFELITPSPKEHRQVIKKAPKLPLFKPLFAGFTSLLTHALEVREVGSGTVDGQPATTFFAVLDPNQVKKESKEANEAVGSASRMPMPIYKPTKPESPLTITLEMSFLASGLPVRTKFSVQTGKTTFTRTTDIPAINFPLTITAPPASKTITVARLRMLERRDRRRHYRKHKG